MEKGSADETIFCSFATNKNVANPGEAGSSPNLAKMVVTGWLADRNERIITEGSPAPQHRQAEFQAWFCCGDPE